MEPEEPWHAARALVVILRWHVKIQDTPRHCRRQYARGALIFTPSVDISADTQRQCRVALDLLNYTAWWCAMAEFVGGGISVRLASPTPTECAAPLPVVVCVRSQQLHGEMISPPWETLLDANVRLTDTEIAVKRSFIQDYAVETIPSSLSAIPLRLAFKNQSQVHVPSVCTQNRHGGGSDPSSQRHGYA